MDPDGNGDIESFFQKLNNLYNLQAAVDQIAMGAVAGGPRFCFSEVLIKQLHRIALHKLLPDAGSYRKSEVGLSNSPYIPPNHIEIANHMVAFCDYVNAEWDKRDLIYLSAFVLWRLNWIHPFRNGNGRTARASSYLVLCAKHGKPLPPKNTVMEQMVAAKPIHDSLLRQADTIYNATQNIDAAIKPLADFMEELLRRQLLAYFGEK
jgi:Fic family protein